MKCTESIALGWVRWVWKHTPNCAEMSRLASQRLDRPLPLKVRLRIRLHYLICMWCRRYARQLHILHRSAMHLDTSLDALARVKLPVEAKHRMIQYLRRMHAS